MKYIIGLLILCAIVIFHEFGHFIAAKLSGVYVEEFAVGMGPTLISHKSKKSGTIYSVHLLPIGGFCAMKGEDGSDDAKDSFGSASVWKRIAIIVCGPLFNLIMAFMVSCIMIAGSGFDTPTVKTVTGANVKDAGLQTGDVIVSLNGTGVSSSRELYFESWYQGDVMNTKQETLVVKRDGEKKTITFTPDIDKKYAIGISYASLDDGTIVIQAVSDDGAAKVAGIKQGDVITSIAGNKGTEENPLYDYLQKNPLTQDSVEVVYERNNKQHTVELKPTVTEMGVVGYTYNGQKSKSDNIVRDAFYDMKYNANMVFKSLYGLMSGRFTLNDMSGPVAIVKTIGDSYESAVTTNVTANESVFDAISSMMSLIVLISVNLGILNLLPLPALDGGHLFFLLLELIRKKPIDQKIEAKVHQFGLTVLILISMIVIFKDVVSLIL